jgi:subtilisin family serine protease
LFITLLVCIFAISIISAKIVQSDVKNDLKKISLSRSNEKISSNLGLKITNAMPEDEIPVIVFIKKPDKITSKTALMSLLSSAVESGGGKTVRKYNVIDAFSAKMPASKIPKLSEMPEVERIYYDEIVSLPPQPSPESILTTNSTQAIGANYVWNTLGYTGTGIKVAIIDTGINYTHPDLGGGFGSGKKVADGYDFVNNDANPMDDNGHGTHVAGIVAANGTLKGVAPNATLFAVKVLDSTGSGNTSNIIAGIDWSIAHGANVISMSLGGSTQPNDEFADVENIVSDAAVDKGVVVVTAAGNEGPGTDTIAVPASSKKVITVGASSSAGTIAILDDTIAAFSSRGPSAFGRLDPEVVAPGVGINSTWYTGGYKILSGTSMATPHVSGAAALLLQKKPSLTPAQVRAILMHTSSNLTASDFHVFEKGAGIINLTNAFTYNISASINGDDRWEESIIPGFSTTGKLVLNSNNSYSVNFSFSLEAMTDLEKDNNISVSSFNLPDYVIIDAGSSKTINITFAPTSGVKPAIYGTTLIASNPTAGALRIPVVITVPLMGSGSIQGTVDDEADYALAFNGDWIYYKLKSYNGTALKVYLNWTDNTSDLDLYLFAPNGVLVGSSEKGLGIISEVVALNNTVYDEYWVAVHAFSLSGKVSYYLNVSYPTGTKGNLAVAPSSLQSAIASNEVKNFTFSITNDATAKSNLNLSIKKRMAGGNNFSSGTIANTGSLHSLVWDVSSSGMNLNNTRYMNATLQWANPVNNLDLLLGYYNGTQWLATRFASEHNNPQLNQAWEKLENVDIQHYLKNYPNFGVFIKNAGSSETYNLTINFTDIAPWSGASVSENPISLSSGQTKQISVTIKGSQLNQSTTDMVFAIQDLTEDYAAIPIRIDLVNSLTITKTIGVYDNAGTWALWNTTSNAADIAGFGFAGTTPVVGDWNGDGRTDIGVYNKDGNNFLLRNTSAASGYDIIGLGWTGVGVTPVVGDWNGDGKEKVGVYDGNGTWALENTSAPGGADIAGFGFPNTKPVVGDWNGDGKTEVGVYNIAGNNFLLRNTSAASGYDIIGLGWTGVTPVAGDWNGDGKEKVGVYDGNGTWALENTSAPGGADIIGIGFHNTIPMVGDWNGDGKTEVGVYNIAGNNFVLRNTSVPSGYDIIGLGWTGVTPVVGSWS